MRRSFGHELAKTLNDAARSLGLRSYLLHDLQQSSGLRRAGPYSAAAATGVEEDRRQRLADVVGQAGRHLPHHGQPRNVRQLGLALARFFLGPLTLGNISDHATKQTTIAQGENARGDLNREYRPVLLLVIPERDPGELTGQGLLDRNRGFFRLRGNVQEP